MSARAMIHDCYIIPDVFQQYVVLAPTRRLTVSRCSLVMECLHGPGTSVIVRGKLRNRSTHRHFTCNWHNNSWSNRFVSSPFPPLSPVLHDAVAYILVMLPFYECSVWAIYSCEKNKWQMIYENYYPNPIKKQSRIIHITSLTFAL